MIRERYELLSRLGRGGMATVWLAQDTVLGRQVALKEVALSPYGEQAGVQRERALREARAAARVRHPAIVDIYDVFLEKGTPWIVMAYIEGESLERGLEDRVLTEREIARLGRAVLAGLMAAHRAQVLHRDVKPANIVVSREGAVFLVDFGIAKIAGESGLTSYNTLLGTIEFMAPERLDGRAPGTASDLWALGVTFFCALEGYSPLRRDGLPQTVHAITHDPVPRPRRPGPLFDVIIRLLEKDPARRMAAAELDSRLKEITDPAPAHIPPSAPRSAPHSVPRAVPDAAPPSRQPGRPPSRQAAVPADVSAEMVREAVRDGGAAAGARLLLTLIPRKAAALLSAIGSRGGGPLLESMAAEPGRAGQVLALLPATRAGRTLGYMAPESAAALLRTLPPSKGSGVLAHADDRTAGAVIAALGATTLTISLIEALTVRRACEVLEYVPPPLIAALLRESTDGRAGRLLNGLSDPVRTQIARLAS